QLATEERGANARVHEAGGVEEPAVAALDERRNDPGAAGGCEPLERGFPRSVDDRSVDTRVSDFAGGVDDQRTAAAQPDGCRTQAGAAPGSGIGSVERIDEEARLVELRNPIEQPIGKDTHIRPHAANEVEEQEPVHGSVRMIRGDDDRTARRYR